MNPQEFGMYIKGLREEKKITVTELAKEAGISHPYLSQIENGRKGVPSIKVLKKLAGPLDVHYMELVYAAGHIDHPPASVDFGGDDIEKITSWLPILKVNYPNAIRDLEEKYRQYFGEDFNITLRALKSLLWEEPVNPNLGILINEVKDLIDEMRVKEEINTNALDLKSILEGSNKVMYNGNVLTKQDLQRVIDMLGVLFSK
jgi:transcriptional regulator with XRE-family HTH domain